MQQEGRVVIGIDIDGVLRNFVYQFNVQFKKDFPEYASEITEITSWDWFYNYPWDKILMNIGYENPSREDCINYSKKWLEYRNVNILRNAPTYPGMIKALKTAIAEHNDLKFKIITTQSSSFTLNITQSWLKEHDLGDIEFVGTTSFADKWNYCDLMVDDSPLVLNTKPEDKYSIKVCYVYNDGCDSNYWINDLSQLSNRLTFFKNRKK